ncbi:MAG: class I SAM-dependent methyltransferase [Pirellulaceae bacterium]|nr:class I SAM-dependent methyltransferase [Pirellulaceae bacterium]
MASITLTDSLPLEAPHHTWRFDPPLERCPLCAAAALVWFDRDYLGRRVDRCGDCGLLLMNPQYTAGYLDQYYSRYYAGSQRNGALPAGDPHSGSRQVAAKTARLRWLGRFVTPGRLLCVGCGDGLELRLAGQLGWLPEGQEVNSSYVAQLRRQLDLPLYAGELVDLQLPAGRYDAMFLDQVLEHPRRPQDQLREIHRLLRPGGVVLIACPNLGSLANRWKTALGRTGLKQRRGRHYDMFHHLFFYRPQVLRRVLERHFGFDVLAVEGDPEGGRRRDAAGWWNELRRRWPALESSFRLVARKVN